MTSIKISCYPKQLFSCTYHNTNHQITNVLTNSLLYMQTRKIVVVINVKHKHSKYTYLLTKFSNLYVMCMSVQWYYGAAYVSKG